MMKKILILFCVVIRVLSAPIPLVENPSRIFTNDSLFSTNLSTKNNFLAYNNITLCFGNRYYLTSDSIISGNRFFVFFRDSLRYKFLGIEASAFFDQRAISGVTVDRADTKDYSTIEMATGDIYKLTLVFEPTDWFLVSIGKDRYNWGPLELGGLMLSDYNMGFVSLYQQYQIGPFALKGIATQLNSTPWSYANVGDSSEITHRYFSASRLECYRPRWGLSVSQSIIYSGVGRSFEIPYLIPIFPFHFAQLANWRYGNNGDNTYGGIDFYVNFLEKKLQFYGELFVDDFQVDKDDASQSIQNGLAFMAGFRFEDVWKLYGFVEGGQINSFVYNHVSGYSLRYQIKDAFIGSPLGPDQRLIWGNLGIKLHPDISLDFTGWWRQSGEKNINYEYPFDDYYGTRDDPIPFGIVKHEISTWLTGKYRWRGFSAELNGGFSRYLNLNHVESIDKTNYFFGLFLKTGIKIR